MIRRFFLIPTRTQWNGWSLPSKIGLVSFYAGLISFAISVLPLLFAPIPADKVVEKLELLNTQRDWSSMSETLKTIENRVDLTEEYFFFHGRLCVYNPTCLQSPTFYFQKVRPEGKYYQRAIASLLLFSRMRHEQHSNNNKLISELNEIADEFIKQKSIVPAYYFLKLLTLDDTALEPAQRLFSEFIGRYESLIDFSAYPLVVYTGTGGVASVGWAYDVLAVLALFEAKLAFAAHNTDHKNIKVDSIRVWKILYKRANGAALLAGANKQFLPNSTRIVVLDRNQDISRVFGQWTFGELAENLDKTISIIERPDERRKATWWK